MNTKTLGSRTRAPYRHANLLVCLFLVIGVSPFFTGSIKWAMEAFLFVTLVAGARAAAPSRRQALLLAVLAVLSVTARAAHWSNQDQDALLYAFLIGYIAFFSVVATTLTRSLFRSQESITVDTLCGALSIYLIMGLVWSMMYAILERAVPGSFLLSTEQLGEQEFDRFLGFSFTTLTTLGYGNVAPATPKADALSTTEAIVGQFYMAVVIARFVSLHLAQAARPSAQ